MKFIAEFTDYSADGFPIFSIFDEDENFVCEVTLPVNFIEKSGLELGEVLFITRPETC
jgi:hypothetical protein